MQPSDGDAKAPQLDSNARIESLVAKAKAGSNSALGRALDACRPRLLQVARRAVNPRLRHQSSASDLVQDTFVNAAKGFGTFRGQRVGEFVSWLCTILTNRLSEIARRNGRPAQEADAAQREPAGLMHIVDDVHASPSAIAADHEYSELIRAGLARLSPRDREVLSLRFDDCLTFPQIGQRMALTEDAARMLFTRAVKRLKRELSASARLWV